MRLNRLLTAATQVGERRPVDSGAPTLRSRERWYHKLARRPEYAAGVTLLGLLAGVLGSVYSADIGRVPIFMDWWHGSMAARSLLGRRDPHRPVFLSAPGSH